MAESKKRRHDGEGQAKGSGKKRKSAAQQEEDDMMDVEAGINTSISFMDPQLLSDYLAQKVNRFGTELSTVEIADLIVSGAGLMPPPGDYPGADAVHSQLVQGYYVLEDSESS